MTFLYIIGFFGISLIALLVFPFSVFAKVQRMEGRFGYQLAIRYPWKFLGFGIGSGAEQRGMRILLVNKSVYEKSKGKKSKKKSKKDEALSTESVSEEGKPEKKKVKKESKKEKSKREFRDFIQLGKLIRGNVKPIIQFLKDILRCFKKARIEGDLEVGVSDPALMGMLYGMYWTVMWNRQHKVKIEPNFLDTTFSGWAEFEVYITLLPILFAVIKLAFKVPIIKIIRLSKKRKKNNEIQNMEVN